MVLAFHSIFSMYGFWLPNDPRGSGSDYIASWELFRYGPATKVGTRHNVAAKTHDVVARQAAKALFSTDRLNLPTKKPRLWSKDFPSLASNQVIGFSLVPFCPRMFI